MVSDSLVEVVEVTMHVYDNRRLLNTALALLVGAWFYNFAHTQPHFRNRNGSSVFIFDN